MEYLTVKQVAEKLNMEEASIRKRIREKDIFSIRLFGSHKLIRVPSTEIERILKEGGQA